MSAFEFKRTARATNVDIGSVEELSRLDMLDEDGRRRFTFGLIVSLFFAGGSTGEKRHALNAVFFDYLDRVEGAATHLYNYASRRINKPLGSDVRDYVSGSVLQLDPTDTYVVAAARLETPGELSVPTPFFFQSVASDDLVAVSSLDAYFPLDRLSARGNTALRDLLVSWCDMLQPLHGTAGLGVIFPPAEARGSETALAFPFLKRFPGLDFDNSLKWRIRTERNGPDFIRSTNWLSAIDDRRLARVGGVEALAASLGAECTLHPYNGGVVVQAGDAPQLGDMNKGVVPPAYRRVARTLAPLRFEDYAFSLFDVPEPLDPREETIRWIRRFD